MFHGSDVECLIALCQDHSRFSRGQVRWAEQYRAPRPTLVFWKVGIIERGTLALVCVSVFVTKTVPSLQSSLFLHAIMESDLKRKKKKQKT